MCRVVKKIKSHKHIKYIKTVTTLLAWLALGQASSAAPADFETPEYYASTGLDIINAAEAYDQGITGKGVTIGISDIPINFASPEFSNKKNSYMAENKFPPYTDKDGTVYKYGDNQYWEYIAHGSHVAGIAAADKNNLGMHGAAYGAEIVGYPFYDKFAWDGASVDPDFMKPFLENKNLKIINASWGYSPDLLPNAEQCHISSVEAMIYHMLQNPGYRIYSVMMDDIYLNDKLLFRSAGNSGTLNPDNEILLYWHNNTAVPTNIISISALESTRYITRKKGDIQGDCITSYFSNGAMFNEDAAMAAPGTKIFSANSNFANDGKPDVVMSGTSMAAPFATGAAALVQQAFPYMSAKEIGDVMLSTANSRITSQKGFSVKKMDYGGDDASIYIFYPDGRIRTLEQQKKDCYVGLRKYLSPYQAKYEVENFPICDFYNTPVEALVGQGVIDVGKAIKGPGALNARRLDTTDISSEYTIGGRAATQALYHIDTAGFNTVWSNDIKEIRVGLLAADSPEEDLQKRYNYYKTNWLDRTHHSSDEKVIGGAFVKAYIDFYNNCSRECGLLNLPVGLIKSGAGGLTLSGNNTYQGASIAKEGTLTINGSVFGDAYSIEHGIITGKGTIGGILYNRSTTVAGDEQGNGVLKMHGLVSTGKLVSQWTPLGNSQFAVDGAANIAGSTVTANNILPGEEWDMLTASAIDGKVANPPDKPYPASAMVTTSGVVRGSVLKVSAAATNRLGTTDSTINQSFTAMTNMCAFLTAKGDNRRNDMRPLFYMAAPAARATLSALGANTTATTMALAQRNVMASHIVSSRLAEAFALQNTSVPVPTAGLAGNVSACDTDLSLKLDQPVDNDFWFKTMRNWGEGRNSSCYHGTTMAMGWDRAYGPSWRAGAFISHSNISFADNYAHNDMNDTRLGLYGGYSLGPHAGYIYLDYGWLNNDLTRNLGGLNLQATADYGSRLLELGGEYTYDLNAYQMTAWHIIPYANVQLSRLWQEGYSERGAGIFGQRVNSKTNTYMAGGIGLEFKRYLPNGSYGLRLGVKHAFSGADPRLSYGHVGDALFTYEMVGQGDKTHFIMSMGGEAEFAPGWTLAGDAMLQKGKHDKDVMVAVTLRRMW